MEYFFTGCTHWGHWNIVKYCNRPFSTLEEMDEILIKNWNSKIPVNSEVFHLGDFSLGKDDNYFNRILSRLNGRIILIKGNHESLAWKNRSKFYASYDSYREIRLNGQDIVLSHYPILSWNKKSHSSWMLHSHCHYNLLACRKEANCLGKILDVGVDGNDFIPYSFEEIKQIMDKKDLMPKLNILQDHHGENK